MLRFQGKAGFLSKGQKMIAALFLITRHLPESDPLRIELRDLAVQLIESDELFVREVVNRILTLIGAAGLSGLVSEKNVSIIESELRYFSGYDNSNAELIALFPPMTFETKGHEQQKKDINDMSFMSKQILKTAQSEPKRKKTSNGDKERRQEKIVSYINDRKSANIKDISTLFPDVSEKTIQRELGTLVSSGKIRKHGNKRWSLYLPIQL
ncbi:DeoR family transcriptional regulator [Candidatus Nomurabacteria bacterium]|nr:DeoR family transcriptional regulator [Candidatus Nomurabacteria bacterium]